MIFKDNKTFIKQQKKTKKQKGNTIHQKLEVNEHGMVYYLQEFTSLFLLKYSKCHHNMEQQE